jgi:hypothetical protein
MCAFKARFHRGVLMARDKKEFFLKNDVKVEHGAGRTVRSRGGGKAEH